jgi:hypothetical protein
MTEPVDFGSTANGTPYGKYKASEKPPTPELRLWTPEEIWAPLPEPDYLIDRVAVRGSLVLIVAYGASLKTWALEDGALSIATASPWLQRFETKLGQALIVDFESGSYELRRRAHRIAQGRGYDVPVPGFTFASMPALSLADDAFYEALAPLAKIYQFIGIDSLAAGSGGIDENDSRFATSLNRLKAIAEQSGCVIVVLHHSRKGSGEDSDPREMVRGSSAIFNACDVVLQLMRTKDEGRFVMRQTKARGGKAVEPFMVRVEDTSECGSVVIASDANEQDDGVEAGAVAFNAVKARIIHLLAHERDIRSANEIYRRIRGTKKTVLEAIKELEERQTIAKVDGAYRLLSEVAA